jgi:peptidoglycan hydrolase-like protein with peptidoglycan-binding domain
MGSRKKVRYTADVIDSRRSDWWLSDDGHDRGPIDSWPAPFIGSDNGSNAVPRRELRRAGTRDDIRFDGHVGPVPRTMPARTFFDDGGMNVEGRKLPVGMSSPVIKESRRTDALFSRTGLRGDAYAFLRRQDPGSDLTYAPRRGPEYATSTSSVMSGAGDFFYESDAADIYGDIQNWNIQVAELLRQYVGLRPGQYSAKLPEATFRNELNPAFANIQAHATDSDAWKAVGNAHQVTYGILKRALGREPSPRQGAELQALFQKISSAMPGGGNLLSKIGGAISSVGEGALSTVKSVGEGALSVGKGLGGTLINVATSPAKLASDIVQGKNVLSSLSDTVKRDLQSAKELAPYAQAVLSVVPGVGQGVNAAIAAGSALAHGQNITDALVQGVKGMVPGGPLAQRALDTAYNLAKGQSITDAALSAARNQLPPGPAQTAFDTGLALAKGKKLQDVAKEQGMSFLSDTLQNQLSPIAGRALSSVGPRVGQVISSAMSIIPQNVNQAAKALLNNPILRSLPISDVARRLNIPERDVQAAVASITKAASKTGMGQVVRALPPAPEIAQRIGNASFDRTLSRFGSRMAPIAMGHNRSAPRVLPRYPHLMPGAMGLQDAGAFSTIKLGSSGPDVQAWQNVLGIAADGKFGPQTDAATRAWQRSHGLTADGVVGPQTWAASGSISSTSVPSAPSSPGVTTLPEIVIAAAPPPPLTGAQVAAAQSMPTIRLGSSGPAVQTWQGILQRDSGISGFPPGPLDGQFGPQTDAATRSWQKNSGLPADGVVGPNTWKKAIGSLTTAPLPAEKTPGVPQPSPVPPGLPPGLPPVPTQPASAPAPISTVSPVSIPLPPPAALPPIFSPPPPPPAPVVSTPPPSQVSAPPAQEKAAGGAVAALALGGIVTKLIGLW